MNEIKELELDISISQKDKSELIEENRFNELLQNFNTNLKKRLYKKTLKEINSLLEADNNIERFSYSWKLYILKIRTILSIIKNKIRKYLVNNFEKARIKYHINTIKKYFSKIPKELTNLYKINEVHISNNDFELIIDLLLCYLDYILFIAFFHKKLGNIIDAIAYLSYIYKLYKETLSIPITSLVLIKFEMGFIALIHLHICNEDYSLAFDYLNIAMDICFKNIILQTKDLSDGVYKYDKYNSKTKNENKIYNIDKSKKIILNIIFLFLFRSICYENTGNIINAIKCDYQSIWFLNNFYTNDFKYFQYLSKNILEKRLILKKELNYIEKKINYFEEKQKNKNKKVGRNNIKNEKNNETELKIILPEKYEGLVKKLEKLKIPEIDITNIYEIKNNLKRENSQKIRGRNSINYLYGIRLYNTFLREDFRPIIDSMKKIKSFEIDYETQGKIQKLIRQINFEHNQQNIKIKKIKFRKKNLNISLPNFKALDKFKKIKINRNILKNSSISTKNTQTHFFSSIDINNIYNSLPDANTKINFKSNSTKNKPIDLIKNLKQKIPLLPPSTRPTLQKIKKIPKYKIIKPTSICNGTEIYKEDETLNKFFNKKYLEKRAFIKKLESRELIFQKYLLKIKNDQKIPFTPYNDYRIKLGVENKYNKIMSLSVSPKPLFKDNLSKEEYHKVKVFKKLQNNFIKSLNTSALIKFKEEEKKLRQNKKINIDESDKSKNKINQENKSMIEKLNINLEDIIQRKNFETNNFIKFLNDNNKIIRHRNDKYFSLLLRKNKQKEKNEII